MALIRSTQIHRGQKHLDARMLDEMRVMARQSRKGIPIVSPDNQARSVGTSQGPILEIDALPMLYRLVQSDAPAGESSSSSETGERHVHVQAVDATTGNTFGPKIRVIVPE